MLITSFSDMVKLYLGLAQVCGIYSISYLFFYQILSFNKSFETLPFGKKLYVVKNVIKSISLCYLSAITIRYIPSYITMGDIDVNITRWWGSIFVANDLTALFLVKNLPSNTRNHHLMTTFLLQVVFLFDGNELEIVKFIVIYTIFSYYAFLVNLYLGFRFLVLENPEGKKHITLFNDAIDKLRILAYYNYGICLLINWTFHIYYALYQLTRIKLSHIIYFFLLVPIIKDDIILLKWLKYKKNSF